MEWIEGFVETSKQGLEVVSGLLYRFGLTGLMIHDKEEFEEFLKTPGGGWDYIEDGLIDEKLEQATGITFYLTNNASGLEQFHAIERGLEELKKEKLDLGPLTLTVKNIREEDWANNWKQYFKPFCVGEKLLIKPSWEKLEDNQGRTVLEIDPGHLFGTGSHETTQLCLELIERHLRQKDTVLDVGCGSGILSIGALLLGAGHATAVDIEPNAVETVRENARSNGILDQDLEILCGNVLEDERFSEKFLGQGYDLITANIVADIVIGLSQLTPGYIKKGGIFVCSGIILARLEDVKEALTANGFTILEIVEKGEWAAVASRFSEVEHA